MAGSAIIAAAKELQVNIRQAAAARFGCAPEQVTIGPKEVRGPDGKLATLDKLVTVPLVRKGAFRAPNAPTVMAPMLPTSPWIPAPDTSRWLTTWPLRTWDVSSIPRRCTGRPSERSCRGLAAYSSSTWCTAKTASSLPARSPITSCPQRPSFPTSAIALEEHPSPHNPLGAKGAGEGGIIAVGGLMANAVAAALRSFAVEPRELPLSPPRVWQLIQDAV